MSQPLQPNAIGSIVPIIGDGTGGGDPPTGPAGGDLSGTYPDPIVVGFQNRPVNAAAPNVGDAYLWDGTEWVPAPPPSAAGGGADTRSATTTQPITTSAAWVSAGLSIVVPSNGDWLLSGHAAIDNDNSATVAQLGVSINGAPEVAVDLLGGIWNSSAVLNELLIGLAFGDVIALRIGKQVGPGSVTINRRIISIMKVNVV